MNKKCKIIFSASFAIIFVFLFSYILKIFIYDEKDSDSVSFGEKNEITILNSWNSSKKNDVLLSLISEYAEQRPDIAITNESLSEPDFIMRLQTDFSSGQESDILIGCPSYNLRTLYERGKIANLSDILRSDSLWYSSIDKNTLSFASVSTNDIYGITTESEYIAMYINETLFHEYGVAVPKNYNDLLAAVSAFNSRKITPIACGFADADVPIYPAVVSALGGALSMNNVSSGAENPAPYFTGALDYIKQLYSRGAFSEDCMQMTRKDAQKVFINNSAAMIVESSGFAGDICLQTPPLAQASETNYKIYAFPEISPSNLVLTHDPNRDIHYTAIPYGAGSSTFFASTAAFEKNYENTVDILKYLTSKQSSHSFYMKTKYMCCIKNATDNEPKRTLIIDRDIFLNKITEYSPMPGSIIESHVWTDMLQAQLPAVLSGAADAETVWSRAYAALNSISRTGNTAAKE